MRLGRLHPDFFKLLALIYLAGVILFALVALFRALSPKTREVDWSTHIAWAITTLVTGAFYAVIWPLILFRMDGFQKLFGRK